MVKKIHIMTIRNFQIMWLVVFAVTAVFLSPKIGQSATLKAVSSLTIMNVTSWQAREVGDTPISNFPVTSTLWGVTVTPTLLSWKWSPGLNGLIYVFYSEDGGKTYRGWGWDYVTPYHTSKILTAGYTSGWFGTAVGTCASCTGYPARTTVYFTNSYH